MNISTKAVMNSLPLVASVLGKKYGVKVVIGGDQAYTDGSTIHLPSLPLDCDEKLLALVRGFTDHEAAHIRETDFSVLEDKAMTPLTKHIWNIFEDWRVENALAKKFPGCRQNFNWLIHHQFSKKADEANDLQTQILNYLLYTVRSWDCSAIALNADLVGYSIEKVFPDLLEEVNTVLTEVKGHCFSSHDCLVYAGEIVKLLSEEQKQNPQKKPAEGLKKLLDAKSDDLPDDLGKKMAKELQTQSGSSDKAISLPTETKKFCVSFSADEVSDIKRASTGLQSRLHGLLQSQTMKRSLPSRSGKLNPAKLYRLVTGSPKLFQRHEERQGLNTLVHILLDTSGSMQGEPMILASKACYAVAHSLDKIPGVSPGVTAFPARRDGVYPILKHGENIHGKFKVRASGSTPLGETILWALQETWHQPQKRKIILIISDGEADCRFTAEKAISHGRSLGYEFYGLGIQHKYINELLPGKSEVISDLTQIAPALFNILQQALTKGVKA